MRNIPGIDLIKKVTNENYLNHNFIFTDYEGDFINLDIFDKFNDGFRFTCTRCLVNVICWNKRLNNNKIEYIIEYEINFNLSLNCDEYIIKNLIE